MLEPCLSLTTLSSCDPCGVLSGRDNAGVTKAEPKPELVPIGQRVKALREQRSLGLRELARQTDLTPGVISRLEGGERLASTWRTRGTRWPSAWLARGVLRSFATTTCEALPSGATEATPGNFSSVLV